MTNPDRHITGGGVFIALGALAGVIAGRYLGGQFSIGVLAGLAAGGAIALAMWLFNRR